MRSPQKGYLVLASLFLPISLSTLHVKIQAAIKLPLWQKCPDGINMVFLAGQWLFRLRRNAFAWVFCGFIPSLLHPDTPGSSQGTMWMSLQCSTLRRLRCTLVVISAISQQVHIKTCFAKKSTHKVRVNSFLNRKLAGKVLNSPCLVKGQRMESFRKGATHRVWTLTLNSVPNYTILTWEEPTRRYWCKKAKCFQRSLISVSWWEWKRKQRGGLTVDLKLYPLECCC